MEVRDLASELRKDETKGQRKLRMVSQLRKDGWLRRQDHVIIIILLLLGEGRHLWGGTLGRDGKVKLHR